MMVIDDGSTDDTRKTLEPYSGKINYIYQENSGVSAARNTGIRAATGKWLAFLDSDDEWMPEYLSIQMEKASQNSNICMQSTDAMIIHEKTSYFEMNESLPEFKEEYLYIEKPFYFIVKHEPWQVGSTIMLHGAVIKAGLFDTGLTISEDFDLMARMALQGSFGMIRRVLVKICRRDEVNECLTNQLVKNPVQCRESDERVYEKLKRVKTLSCKEIQALNYRLSSNRRAMGNLLLEKGKRKEARISYRRALIIYPSLASVSKYILSFLPARTNLWINNKNRHLKEERKTRSQSHS
jgi:glycosyltransferase involved in cell wall biosynthesis